jgi:hypothetical protein
VARTEEGATLTTQHRAAQTTLRAAVVRELLILWQLFDPNDPKSYDRFIEAATVVIGARRSQSAQIAAAYYDRFREAEVGGRIAVNVAADLPPEQIAASLRATGLAGTLRALRLGQSAEAAARNGFVLASGAGSRLTINGARDTIVGTAQSERMHVGWQRVTDGEPCYFCAMLASRGPVYREETVGFQAHDHCACVPEPVYEGSRMPALNQQFRDLWNTSTHGLGGSDAIHAFRAALGG